MKNLFRCHNSRRGRGKPGNKDRGLTGFVGRDFRILSRDKDRSGYCSARGRSISATIVSENVGLQPVFKFGGRWDTHAEEGSMETHLRIRNRSDRRNKGWPQAVPVLLPHMSTLWSWPNGHRLTNQRRGLLSDPRRALEFGQLQAACFAPSPGRLEHRSSVR